MALVAIVLGFWGVASAVVPTLNDPSQSLARVAKRVLAGPKSAADSKKLSADFDDAVKSFLLTSGKLPSPELIKKLQSILASSAFEVHAFELPRGLRVIEIDTILQANDYLVMNTSTGTKVFILPDLEVFDAAQLIQDQARLSLVLVGHSSGQGAHHPQVKVFALLPDDIQDESVKAVPTILGEGTAIFAPNKKDIAADLSLYSIGAAQHIFKPQTAITGRGEEETVRTNLIWKDGRYTLQQTPGRGALAALYAVSHCLQKPEEIDQYSRFLSSKAVRFIKEAGLKGDNPEFVIGKTTPPVRQRTNPTVTRLLIGSKGNSFSIDLQKQGEDPAGHVIATSIKKIANTATPATATNTKASEPTVAASTVQTTSAQEQALIHHEAQIVEKKVLPKQKTEISIEDRIISSSKPSAQTKNNGSTEIKIKETPTKTKVASVAPILKMDVAPPAVETKEKQKPETEKKTPVDSKKTAVKQPVDEISPPIEKVVDGNFNVRRGPSNGYRTLAHVHKGNRVEIIGKKNGWYKVRSGGTEGFISADALDEKKAEKLSEITHVTTPKKTASSIPTKRISAPAHEAPAHEAAAEPSGGLSAGTVNRNRTLRDENHQPISIAKQGDKVVILSGLKNGKYKIKLPNGKTGYVDKETVDVSVQEPQFVP